MLDLDAQSCASSSSSCCGGGGSGGGSNVSSRSPVSSQDMFRYEAKRADGIHERMLMTRRSSDSCEHPSESGSVGDETDWDQSEATDPHGSGAASAAPGLPQGDARLRRDGSVRGSVCSDSGGGCSDRGNSNAGSSPHPLLGYYSPCSQSLFRYQVRPGGVYEWMLSVIRAGNNSNTRAIIKDVQEHKSQSGQSTRVETELQPTGDLDINIIMDSDSNLSNAVHASIEYESLDQAGASDDGQTDPTTTTIGSSVGGGNDGAGADVDGGGSIGAGSRTGGGANGSPGSSFRSSEDDAQPSSSAASSRDPVDGGGRDSSEDGGGVEDRGVVEGRGGSVEDRGVVEGRGGSVEDRGSFDDHGGVEGRGGFYGRGGIEDRRGVEGSGSVEGRGSADDRGGVKGLGGVKDCGGVEGRDSIDDRGGVEGRDSIDDRGGVEGRDSIDDRGGVKGRDGVEGRESIDDRGSVKGPGGVEGRDSIDDRGGVKGRGGAKGRGSVDDRGGGVGGGGGHYDDSDTEAPSSRSPPPPPPYRSSGWEDAYDEDDDDEEEGGEGEEGDIDNAQRLFQRYLDAEKVDALRGPGKDDEARETRRKLPVGHLKKEGVVIGCLSVFADVHVKEFIVFLSDEMIQAFLVDPGRCRSVANRTKCEIEVTRRILNRRMGRYRWLKYLIVDIRGPSFSAIDQCDKMMIALFPPYRGRKPYGVPAKVSMFLKESTPDNTDLYFNFQRTGPSQRMFGEIPLRAPFRKTKSRPLESTPWKSVQKRQQWGILEPKNDRMETVMSHVYPERGGTLTGALDRSIKWAEAAEHAAVMSKAKEVARAQMLKARKTKGEPLYASAIAE